MSTYRRQTVALILAATAWGVAAGEKESPFDRALVSGRTLVTVEIAADETPVGDGGATVAKGRRFGVVAAEDGRVRICVSDGEALRREWIERDRVRVVSDDEVDVAGEALRMAVALNPEADADVCRRRLDALVDRLAEAAGTEGSARERVRRIGRRLFGAEGYTYRKGVKRLDQVLARKQGDCVPLSLIYLAAARRLRMPIHLVTWPSHVLVRYEHGPDRFNIETTERGEIRNVDDPIQHRRGRVAGGIHCMALPNPRALGIVYHVWGAILSQRGRHREACERFARAVEINPRDAEAHALWGAALHKLARYDAACARHADVVAIDPQHGEANIRWAFALNRLRRYGEAAAKAARATELAPAFADGWYAWAYALTRLGRHAEACEKFAKATEHHRRFAEAYAGWGGSLTRLGQFAEADRKYAKAALFDPQSGRTYGGWGYTLAQMGKHAEACEKYAKAVRLNPKDARVLNNWGWALARLGRHDEAVEKCRQSVKLDATRAASHHSLGVALAGQGKLDAACAAFADAVKVDPRHALSYADWGATLARLGRRAEALEKLDRALALDPDLKGYVPYCTSLGVPQ